jgi:tetratricopeptide (TPR) repeat protein
MKQIVLLVAIALSSVAFSQKKNVTNAAMNYKYFNDKRAEGDKEGAVEDILKAKEYIDLAAENAETVSDPKMFMYKGQIYVDLATFAKETGNDKLAEYKDKKILNEGYEALKLSGENDEKGRYEDDIRRFVDFYRNKLYTTGNEAYSEQKYEVAMNSLLGAAALGEIVGVVDSSFYFFGGISAFNAELLKEAQEAFQKCIAINYKVDKSVAYSAAIFQKQGKSEEAEKALKDAIAQYPTNKGLLIELINFYIDNDRDTEALDALNAAIELDPENTALLFNSGAIYENMGNFEKAKEAYEKLIVIEPEAVRGQFAIGGLYFNQGAELNNKANQLPLGDPNYDTLTEEAKMYFEKSVPYLEKAAAKSSEDIAILESLMAAYRKIGNTEKFKEVKAQIEAVKAK